ncbi:hypothetical protein Efla_004012 [Eimeria flavescens]
MHLNRWSECSSIAVFHETFMPVRPHARVAQQKLVFAEQLAAAATAMDLCDDAGPEAVHSTAEQQIPPAAAAPSSVAVLLPCRHVGPPSWSWNPGVCGACACPTSGWSLLPRGPQWLPSDPQARVHLRLLWGFYTSSLPHSCVAMRGALRVGALSALRAEATLLSILARGLGFSCLALSARRLAEICDVHDTGGPNPAWGSHHPLATADGLWGSLADLANARRQSKPSDGSDGRPGPSTDSGSNSDSCATGCSCSSRCSGSSSTRADRRRRAGRPSSSAAHCGNWLTAEAARSAATVPTEHSLAKMDSMAAGNSRRTYFGPHQRPSSKSVSVKQRPVQQQRQQQQQHQQQHQEQPQEQQAHQGKQQQRQQQAQRMPLALHQPQLLDQECQGSQDQHQQHQQQQDAWDRVAALRRGILSSAIRLPGHPVHEALFACLLDLHAAKQQLALLFEDCADDGLAVGEAAQTIKHFEESVERQTSSASRPTGRSRWPAAAVSAAVAATAAATAMATALHRLTCRGYRAMAAAASWLQWPFAFRSWRISVLAGLLRRGFEKGAAAAAAAPQAAAAAARRGYSLRSIQNVLLLGEWVWGPTAWLATWRSGSLSVARVSLIGGPSMLHRLFTEGARERADGWVRASGFLNRFELPAAGAPQQLQQLYQLLLDWKVVGLHRWREVFAGFTGESRSRRTSTSSAWATPEGLRREGSTSACCYWSPPEGPLVCSQEEPLSFAHSVSAMTLQQQNLLQVRKPHALQQEVLEGQAAQQLRHLQQRLEESYQGWQEQSERKEHPGAFCAFESTPRGPSAASLVAMRRAEAQGGTRGLSAPEGLRKSYREPWPLPIDPSEEIRSLAGFSAGEGAEDASNNKVDCATPFTGLIPSSSRSNSSSKLLAQATAASRAAAVGAAAAAATASWGAANAAWPGARRKSQRHVSFLADPEEGAFSDGAGVPASCKADRIATARELQEDSVAANALGAPGYSAAPCTSEDTGIAELVTGAEIASGATAKYNFKVHSHYTEMPSREASGEE